jgi:hypothetical protein
MKKSYKQPVIKGDQTLVSVCHQSGWTLIIKDISEKSKKMQRLTVITCAQCKNSCDLVIKKDEEKKK